MKTIVLTTAMLLGTTAMATANTVVLECEVKPIVNAAGETLYFNKVDPTCVFSVNGNPIESLKDEPEIEEEEEEEEEDTEGDTEGSSEEA